MHSSLSHWRVSLHIKIPALIQFSTSSQSLTSHQRISHSTLIRAKEQSWGCRYKGSWLRGLIHRSRFHIPSIWFNSAAMLTSCLCSVLGEMLRIESQEDSISLSPQETHSKMRRWKSKGVIALQCNVWRITTLSVRKQEDLVEGEENSQTLAWVKKRVVEQQQKLGIKDKEPVGVGWCWRMARGRAALRHVHFVSFYWWPPCARSCAGNTTGNHTKYLFLWSWHSNGRRQKINKETTKQTRCFHRQYSVPGFDCFYGNVRESNESWESYKQSMARLLNPGFILISQGKVL